MAKWNKHRLIYKIGHLWCQKNYPSYVIYIYIMDIKWYWCVLMGVNIFWDNNVGTWHGTTHHRCSTSLQTRAFQQLKPGLWCLCSTGTNVRNGVPRFLGHNLTTNKTRLLHSIPFRILTFSLTSVAAAGAAEGSSATVAPLVSPVDVSWHVTHPWQQGTRVGHPEWVVQTVANIIMI